MGIPVFYGGVGWGGGGRARGSFFAIGRGQLLAPK